MTTPQDVLAFWLDEVAETDWYRADDDLDRTITEKFGATLERAARGSLGLWLTCPSETLAYIIVTDQFSRNIHRDSARGFATDCAALSAAKMAIARDWDLKIDPPARQFFYTPLMHSENLVDQDRAVRLFHTRMPNAGAGHLEHAQAHREIIRRFGRFPYRNKALGRETTAQERAFLDQGGYGALLRDIQSKAA